MFRARHPWLTRCLILVGALVLLAAACSRNGPDATSTPPPTPTATATATATVSPSPTATLMPTTPPTATSSPTPVIPPTVAVTANDNVRSCLERNLTPALLLSLSKGDDTLANTIIRTCLETQLPSELVFLLGPIINTTSQCALDESKTLSNNDLIALAGPDGDAKTQVTNRVTNDILTCVANQYNIPTNLFGSMTSPAA